jgi:DNA-binding transcriptional MerR regulator
MKTRDKSISEVARAAHVSVRTLRHYDETGLLVPSARSANGYRRYSVDDERRLLSIVIFKQLGFSLPAIEKLLDDPTADRTRALEEQRALLVAELHHTQAALRAVDTALEVERTGTRAMTQTIFDDVNQHKDFEAEAKERWGNTAAYQESIKRTKHYTPDDWAAIKTERDNLAQRFAILLGQGKQPTDDVVMDVAEEHRAHLERWFYPCSTEMHRGLGRMYVDDARFAANFEKLRPGLAAFVCAAFEAHAAR